MNHSIASKALSIVLGAYISEDAALLSAASLAASMMLSTHTAFLAAVFGISSGDIALYAVARNWASTTWGKRICARSNQALLRHASEVLRRWQLPALVVSRVVPGTRLPMTLAAGATRMPLWRFVAVSVLCSVIWAGVVFRGVAYLHRSPSFALYLCSTIAIGVSSPWLLRASTRVVRRLAPWEFWPAWLFYAPVLVMYLWLGLKHRGLLLPSVANLNQRNGGIVGESKVELLKQLAVADASAVANSYSVPELPVAEREKFVRNLVGATGIRFPFILKPDVAQRGAGFRVLRTWADVRNYLEVVHAALVLQPYVAGPCEAGVFYHRRPSEERGHILAITDKVFPSVVGDGKSTINDLIQRHPRAEFAGRAYLQRWKSRLSEVLPSGSRLRLVEAGNHCQGCEFRDGLRLYSPELHDRIDRISRGIAGFYIGRYDLRYANEEALRRGEFTIIELNGASSEATSLYDRRNTLVQAYRMLYRQWELVFRIAAENRRRGARPVRLLHVLSDWIEYRRVSAQYPQAS